LAAGEAGAFVQHRRVVRRLENRCLHIIPVICLKDLLDTAIVFTVSLAEKRFGDDLGDEEGP
jgi:hypothetical protein